MHKVDLPTPPFDDATVMTRVMFCMCRLHHDFITWANGEVCNCPVDQMDSCTFAEQDDRHSDDGVIDQVCNSASGQLVKRPSVQLRIYAFAQIRMIGVIGE